MKKTTRARMRSTRQPAAALCAKKTTEKYAPRVRVRCEARNCRTVAPFDISRTDRLSSSFGAKVEIAIRCEMCLRVFCRKHARQHFGICRLEKQAEVMADRIVSKMGVLKAPSARRASR